MESNTVTSTELIASVIGLIILVFNSIFNWMVAKRNRDWERENRKWQLEDETRKDNLHRALLENTEITKSGKEAADKAYKEANDLNLKLKTATETAVELVKSQNRDPRMRTRATDDGKS